MSCRLTVREYWSYVLIFGLKLKLGSYVAELLQHLLAMGQVWSHELGSIHLDLLPYFPGGQARLGENTGDSLQTN